MSRRIDRTGVGRCLAIGVAGALGCWAGGATAGATGADGGAFTVVFQPAAADGAGALRRLHIEVEESLPPRQAGVPLLHMPLVKSNVQTSAAALEHLQASDAKGLLPLIAHDDHDGAEPYRHWVATRAISGPLRIRYDLPIGNLPNPLGAAPPFELRSEDKVFSGLSAAFILLPDDQRSYRFQQRWNLTALGSDTLGLSTEGIGDVSSQQELTASQLESIYVMGGQLGHEPARPGRDGFFSAWQGHPPFDPYQLMQWTHGLYGYYLKFFRSPGTTYTVYLRRNPINPGGGVEVGHSFVGTFDKNADEQDFKFTLAHEMVHTFVGALDASDELEASWFAEGLAVYYQRELPRRAGLVSRDQYLRDLNATAARYYTDLLNTLPNAQISDRFWADTRVRVLPYDRGALYFAQLNEAIVKASAGQRSLDDLLLGFLQRRLHGQSLTEDDWRRAVVAELGPAGGAQLDAMLQGHVIQLDASTFGRCLTMVKRPMRRFDLGFTPDALIEPTRIVRGLEPDSAAARAGLRNGDHILRPVAQDAIQGDQTAMMKLSIQRGARVLAITYLPRGETLSVDQWQVSQESGCSSAP
ncbi:M61 family metallopeptidase [Frateuria aurantia]